MVLKKCLRFIIKILNTAVTSAARLFAILFVPIKWLLLFLIRVYQKTISPDHGVFRVVLRGFGFCRFEPTCSEYMYQAIKKYGVVRGILKGVWRILRCNPWGRGGIDLP